MLTRKPYFVTLIRKINKLSYFFIVVYTPRATLRGYIRKPAGCRSTEITWSRKRQNYLIDDTVQCDGAFRMVHNYNVITINGACVWQLTAQYERYIYFYRRRAFIELSAAIAFPITSMCTAIRRLTVRRPYRIVRISIIIIIVITVFFRGRAGVDSNLTR